MAKSKQKIIRDDIEAWLEFLQENWPAIRDRAARLYASEGRGAFLVDMSQPKDPALLEGNSLPYLSNADAARGTDSDKRRLVSGYVAWYDPERQIAFLLKHSEDPTTVYQRVLGEYPDGTPYPTAAASKQRWCGFERTCPHCDHRFIGLADFAQCPRCEHGFSASDEEYLRRSTHPIEPIGRYIPPGAPPEDYDALESRIREQIICDGEDSLDARQRLVWYALEMNSEVRNGGWDQYFWNEAGNQAAELLQLLQASRLDRAAGLMKKACEPFPRGVPSPDRMVRHEQIDNLPEGTTELLDELANSYYELFPEWDDLKEDLWREWQATQETDA